MITSDLESFCIRLLLGGVLDIASRGSIPFDVASETEALLTWSQIEGFTDAAVEEILVPGWRVTLRELVNRARQEHAVRRAFALGCNPPYVSDGCDIFAEAFRKAMEETGEFVPGSVHVTAVKENEVEFTASARPRIGRVVVSGTVSL
jgi:hypothetical protein